MLPPEHFRQLTKGNHLEQLKQAELQRQLRELQADKPSWKERFYLQIGNRLIELGESVKVLAEPRYNVPQQQ